MSRTSRPLQVAVATTGGVPTDPGVWSTTPYHVVKALSARDDLQLHLVGPVDRTTYFLGRAVASLTRHIGRRTNWEAEPWFLQRLTRSLDRALRVADVDVALALGWTRTAASGNPAPRVLG